MIITGSGEFMDEFQSICKERLVCTYNKMFPDSHITLDNVFIVWACKTLQNCKALAATTVSGDGVYVEYTYNGDKQELYEDVYLKQLHTKYE